MHFSAIFTFGTINAAAFPALAAPIGHLENAKASVVPAAGLQARASSLMGKAEPIGGTAVVEAGIVGRDVLEELYTVHKEQTRDSPRNANLPFPPLTRRAESMGDIDRIFNRLASR
ncbi:hypothetical protein BC835DRAFT_1309721 [Cytidiella melzeri]|nr:hypothetical protein BC835DRAFT_1309721 [Cytidiella melzeri]